MPAEFAKEVAISEAERKPKAVASKLSAAMSAPSRKRKAKALHEDIQREEAMRARVLERQRQEEADQLGRGRRQTAGRAVQQRQRLRQTRKPWTKSEKLDGMAQAQTLNWQSAPPPVQLHC